VSITLSSLHVYPVKGLKGIDLETARCTDRGLEHDRRWMVVDAQGAFLTQREHPKMATVWTDITSDSLVLSVPDAASVEVPLAAPCRPTMRVQVWNSTCDAVPASAEADRFLSEYLGLACRLVYMPERSERYSNSRYGGEGHRVGFADGYAYLLAAQASLADLNSRLEARSHPAVPMNRFRPNFVVAGGLPYAEDGWGEIRIGGAVLRGAKPCGRCQVTTTDQSSGEVTGPEPLATLSTYRESGEFGVMFGMNLVTVKMGPVRVGDALEIS
jgi:uncharacterized protein YcbX